MYNKKYYIKCKNCGFLNLKGTNYCQRCGKDIKKPRFFLDLKTGGMVAGISNKCFSLAPVVSVNIEDQIENKVIKPIKKEHFVRVVPLENGDWYCPNCGEFNKKHNKICIGCGREFY